MVELARKLSIGHLAAKDAHRSELLRELFDDPSEFFFVEIGECCLPPEIGLMRYAFWQDISDPSIMYDVIVLETFYASHHIRRIVLK